MNTNSRRGGSRMIRPLWIAIVVVILNFMAGTTTKTTTTKLVAPTTTTTQENGLDFVFCANNSNAKAANNKHFRPIRSTTYDEFIADRAASHPGPQWSLATTLEVLVPNPNNPASTLCSRFKNEQSPPVVSATVHDFFFP